jgi:hypothetical protein
MAQAGLHVPAAAGSRLPVFRSIFADIGEHRNGSILRVTHHASPVTGRILHDAGQRLQGLNIES